MTLGPISQGHLSINLPGSVEPKIAADVSGDGPVKLTVPGGDAADLFAGKQSTIKLDDVAGLTRSSSRSGQP